MPWVRHVMLRARVRLSHKIDFCSMAFWSEGVSCAASFEIVGVSGCHGSHGSGLQDVEEQQVAAQ